MTADEVIEQIKNRPRGIGVFPNYRITDYSLKEETSCLHLLLYFNDDLNRVICEDPDVKKAVKESILEENKNTLHNPLFDLFYDTEEGTGGVDFKTMSYYDFYDKNVIEIVKNTQKGIDNLDEVKKRQREALLEAQKEKEILIKKRRGVL